MFLLTLLPRTLDLKAHWSSDETTWLLRSRDFVVALQDQDWRRTQVAYHPGVTTTWLGGIALWSKYGKALRSAEGLISEPLIAPENLQRCRLVVALLSVVILLFATFLIRELAGRPIAIFAAIFLAIDPLFIAQSRRLHTDALSTGFLLLAVLALLIFVIDQSRYRYLIFSGVCFGLACLSKSNALILALWFPLFFIFFYPQDRCGNLG